TWTTTRRPPATMQARAERGAQENGDPVPQSGPRHLDDAVRAARPGPVRADDLQQGCPHREAGPGWRPGHDRGEPHDADPGARAGRAGPAAAVRRAGPRLR